jgi:CBS domain containing-hemolysin-like protein
MSTETSDIKLSTATPATVDDKRYAFASWLDTLKSRFGNAGPKTMREMLEHALKKEEAVSAEAFSHEERAMLLRIMRFGKSTVADVMVPRADIIAVDESEPLRELVLTFEKAGVSRVPIYQETLDDPRGMVHIKDLVRFLTAEAAGRPLVDAGEDDKSTLSSPEVAKLDLSRPISATKIKRQLLYVPPSMPATSLLIRMQTSRIHMALVVDEYGGTDGLVTIEDLVEQIVGDIEDEHDEADDDMITTDPRGGIVALARTPVAELEEMLGVTLLKPDEAEDIDTIGGLVFAIVGRVPARGELVKHASGVEFEVLDADPRRVKKLKIHKARLVKTTSDVEVVNQTAAQQKKG